MVRTAETRLLYENATTGIVATVVIAALLAYAQRNVVPRFIVWTWLLYMLLVSAARFAAVRWYEESSPRDTEAGPWHAAFVIGAAMAAVGWGAGAFALYPVARPINEILVVFTLGGVVLGGASLLAARPEAFLAFLLPIGSLTALRLAVEGTEDHLLMGILAAVFTVATALTAWRFHLAIHSAFTLRFDKEELIKGLQAAKRDAEALNRELEFRVVDRTARLIEADQRKDEFLATLAHELRNPLAPIRFALEAMKAGGPASTVAHARGVIERQVTQLVRLVDDLMDVSRITTNKIQLRREPLDLGRLMTTAVESIAPIAAAAGHALDVRLPVSPIRINGDGARLVQVFSNVLNNAVKFTPCGGYIRFAAELQNDEACVCIHDTGVGIAPEILPRVFDMFHQTEPVFERSTGGLGIGLTLARRLVEMHEGRIDVRSPGIGQGTEVDIRLPVIAGDPVATAVSPQPPLGAPRRNLRVLIVEDNVDAAEMLQLAVSHLGHVARMAHDGATAVKVATEFVPDVIFLDIGLPVMNGYAVARALRGMPEFDRVHIAAVTGWGQEEDRRQAREAGCDSHFTKPLSPTTLEEVLARIAQREFDEPRALSTPRTRLTDSGSSRA